MRLRTVAFILFIGFILTVPIGAANSSDVEIVPGKAVILYLEGTVQGKAPDVNEWKDLEKGAWLEQGTVVRTTAGSSCEIGIGEGHKSAVHMKADSQTVLDSLDPTKIRVGLQQGRLFTLVRDLKPGSKFEVASPTAVATARGTGWEQTEGSLRVFESSVEVVGANGDEMLVEAGMGIDIAKDGDLGEAFELPVEAKNEWNNVQESVEKHAIEEPTSTTEPITEEKRSSADAPPDTVFESPEREFEGPGTWDITDDVFDEVNEQTSQVQDQQRIQTSLIGSTLDPNKCFSQGGTNTSC